MMREVQKSIKNIFSKIRDASSEMLDFFFPTSCTGCGAPGIELCDKCLHMCEKPTPLSIKWAEAIFSYKDPRIKRVLWNIKYRGNTRSIEIFGAVLSDIIISKIYEDELPGKTEEYILVPIPMSKKEFRKRGYNQSEILAKSIYKKSVCATIELETRVLIKIKETKSQMSIKNKRERLENLKGCFRARRAENIDGRNIILIDDIVTTGATFREARRVLLDAGAKTVCAFAIAH